MSIPWNIVISAGCGHCKLSRVGPLIRRALGVFGGSMESGKTLTESAVAAMTILEASGAINAGVGAKSNENGQQQLDCCLMDNGELGLTSCVYACPGSIKTPSKLCHALALDYKHAPRTDDGRVKPLVLAGEGCIEAATRLSVDMSNVETVDEQAEQVKGSDTVGVIATDTVNVVVITSTGGYKGKISGRVSATTLPGIGTDIVKLESEKVAYTMTGTSEILLTERGRDFISEIRKGEIICDVPDDIGVVSLRITQKNVQLHINTSAPGTVVGYRTSEMVGNSPVRIYNMTSGTASIMKILMTIHQK